MNGQEREPACLGLDLLWEVPLAVLSWGFFHANKALIGLLYQRHLDRQASLGPHWRILSAETLAQTMSVPVLLTKGPRWNTHATIGTLGPLTVRRELAVDLASVRRSAAAWSVVLYRYPDFLTWDEIGSLEPRATQDWGRFQLPAGRYCLGVRYYDLSPAAQMPQVRVDGAAAGARDLDADGDRDRDIDGGGASVGKGDAAGAGADRASDPAGGAAITTASSSLQLSSPALVPAAAVPGNANAVYARLAERTTPYYRALHHYIHPMLRLRRWLPQAWVRREYLPVGDPCTEFRYDWFPADCSLELRVSPRLHQDCRVYLSVYNRASLPVHSQELGVGTLRTPAFQEAGFYLIRLRPRRLPVPPCGPEDLRIRRIEGHRRGSSLEA